MSTCYFELRQLTDAPTISVAADIAQHLQTRQHLGKTIVLCDKPVALMSAARKQWLKLARTLQRERSSTINAEKILRLTHTITHMHRMRFVAKTPEQQPSAHVFFMKAEDIDLLPVNLYSIYIMTPITTDTLHRIKEQLPADAMLIDYTGQLATNGLQPKTQLHTRINAAWNTVAAFLTDHHIAIESLIAKEPGRYEALDDALDTLLGVSRDFLQIASDFQHALELAQPVPLTPDEQRKYDTLILLAHRVQALNPQGFASHFTHNLTDETTFFLHDVAENVSFAEALAQAIMHHKQAGRTRLARALTFATH